MEIKLEGGTPAKFGGRYVFNDQSGNKQHLNIYFTDKDEAYRATSPSTTVLTPTANWTHELGDGPWQRFHKNGGKEIVLSKDTWNEIKQADEVEVFDPQTYGFVSNVTGEIVDYLPKPNKTEEKKLDNIGEKVAAKMSEEKTKNSTLEMVKEAGFDAAKMVGANQANELITQSLKKALQSMGLTHEFLESEAGHKLMKIIGPLAIHYAADTQAEFINGLVGQNASDHIKEGCKFATQAAIGDVMEPLLTFIVPTLKELATMGIENLAASAKAPIGAISDTENESIEDLMKEKEKAKEKVA